MIWMRQSDSHEIALFGLTTYCGWDSVAGRNVSTILRQSGFAFRLESFGGWSVD